MQWLRLILILLNIAATGFLLAIPFGKLFGFVTQEVDAAAVYGWIIFFVPFLASALALLGIQYARPRLARPSVLVAMPGSFLIALLSFYTFFMGPPAFKLMGLGAAAIFSLNVLLLWVPFRDSLR